MTTGQLAVFSLERNEVTVKLRASWADRKTTVQKRKILKSLRKALEEMASLVQLAEDAIQKRKS